MNQAKPFSIPKRLIWEAYKRVKANRGACGVDEISIQDLEKRLEDTLYKLWNRMSSGSYFPPPVRTVEIPKKSGGTRPLGIPTVLDRIAQMVVKMMLEVKIEPHFHPDSYGYRPRKSAIQALGQARRRCWRYDWVIDLDIKGFFDTLDHELLMKAIRHHTDSKWMLLYIERWLKAPSQDRDGNLTSRDKGTPQGGVISPLLSNLYLHYAFDDWMRREYPHCPYERFADDIVVHCSTEIEAKTVMEAIAKRLADCRLQLHPTKTKLVYCKDSNRRKDHPEVKFDFLGYSFRPRRVKSHRGEYFISFTPAISSRSATSIRRSMRRWRLHLKSSQSLEDLASKVNPVVRGWINYYGQYHRSQLYPVFRPLNQTLIKWAMRKHKKLRKRLRRTWSWLHKVQACNPRLFAHWQIAQPSHGWMIGAV